MVNTNLMKSLQLYRDYVTLLTLLTLALIKRQPVLRRTFYGQSQNLVYNHLGPHLTPLKQQVGKAMMNYLCTSYYLEHFIGQVKKFDIVDVIQDGGNPKSWFFIDLRMG